MAIGEDQIKKCISLAKEFSARKLILFGSVLEKPEATNDIDLACDGISEWKLYEFGAPLEELLSVLVDAVALNTVNRFTFTQYIEKKGSIIYES